MSELGRLIGIRHRRKQTKENEARPSQVVIQQGETTVRHDLGSDDDELDFVRGRFPIKWRDATAQDDLTQFNPRHIKTRKLQNDESPADFPAQLLRKEGKTFLLATKVPSVYEGVKPGDTIVTMMGGSGDRLSNAMSNPKLRATVLRLPPFHLKEGREGDKEDDALNVIAIFKEHPEKFFPVTAPTREIIQLGELYRLRIDAMKARIACEQRFYQSLSGQVFCSEEGMFPQASIEIIFDEAKAGDAVLLSLLAEEKRRESELTSLLLKMPVYQEVFAPIEGCGPMIAARLIATIGQVLRFSEDPYKEERDALHQRKVSLKKKAGFYDALLQVEDSLPENAYALQKEKAVQAYFLREGLTERVKMMDEVVDLSRQIHKLKQKAEAKSAANLKKYCGVHVNEDGSFPRNRKGQRSSGRPDCRQAEYLLQDQWNRRPDSKWGEYRKQMKARDRERHPESITVDGKKRYTDGHIHKRSGWRTATRFTEDLWMRWSRFERKQSGVAVDGE